MDRIREYPQELASVTSSEPVREEVQGLEAKDTSLDKLKEILYQRLSIALLGGLSILGMQERVQAQTASKATPDESGISLNFSPEARDAQGQDYRPGTGLPWVTITWNRGKETVNPTLNMTIHMQFARDFQSTKPVSQ